MAELWGHNREFFLLRKLSVLWGDSLASCLIARFMVPTLGQPGVDRTQVGPISVAPMNFAIWVPKAIDPQQRNCYAVLACWLWDFQWGVGHDLCFMGLLPDTQNCGCACAGNAGNVFPVTAGKRSRHASRHVHHARAVMHAGIAN